MRLKQTLERLSPSYDPFIFNFSEGKGAVALIPFSEENKAEGKPLKVDTRGITIANPTLAAVGLARVGEGAILAIFDRQPLWNQGSGSSIGMKDNREMLRRMIRFLAGDKPVAD